jgi:hypothetical protein
MAEDELVDTPEDRAESNDPGSDVGDAERLSAPDRPVTGCGAVFTFKMTSSKEANTKFMA